MYYTIYAQQKKLVRTQKNIIDFDPENRDNLWAFCFEFDLWHVTIIERTFEFLGITGLCVAKYFSKLGARVSKCRFDLKSAFWGRFVHHELIHEF